MLSLAQGLNNSDMRIGVWIGAPIAKSGGAFFFTLDTLRARRYHAPLGERLVAWAVAALQRESLERINPGSSGRLGFDPSVLQDDDLKSILTGLFAIVSGVGALRSRRWAKWLQGPTKARASRCPCGPHCGGICFGDMGRSAWKILKEAKLDFPSY